MITAEPACQGTPEKAGLRVETLAFDQIPQQSRLFLDYLRDPIALRRFYPEAVRFHYEVSARADRVLANHKTDREALCDALDGINRVWGARDEPPPGFVFFPRFERRGPSIDPSWFTCNQGLARERQAGAYLR